MHKPLLLFLFFLPLSSFTQTLSGKIYDSDATVKGAKVINKDQGILVYTNYKGDFEISAKINDILEISSLFHEPQLYLIRKEDFSGPVVIELKKIVNELPEVDLKDLPKEKKFDILEMKSNIGEQIKNDINNNPSLYSPINSAGLDFIAIGKLIGSLFKRNSKNNGSLIPISYYQLDSLFNHSNLINNRFLAEDLNIPKENKYLFIEYCSAKNYPSHLLYEQNQVVLMDSLYISSKEFLQILEENKKD